MDKGSIEKRHQELAEKWMNGSITSAEATEFSNWYHKDQDEPVFVEPEFAPDELTQRNRMLATVRWDAGSIKLAPGNLRRSVKWAVAASIALIAGIAGYFYISDIREMRANRASIYANDVNPGKNTATLTLANGKTVVLSDAKAGVVIDASSLAYSDGEKLNISSESGQLSGAKAMQINTPKGGQYQVILPDGTKVWLNAASSLEFPASFAGMAKRTVRLDGEAYFEVKKLSQDIPFVVGTAKQEVEVLGTHFNIDAYEKDRNSKTTLLEGSVRVSSVVADLSRGAAEVLKPGEQSVLSNGRIKVAEIDTEEAVAWKNGLFMFSGQDLESIMKEVERWYDVEVVFENDNLKKQVFRGTISRFKKISQLLEVLESTGSVHFKMEGRRVTALQ